MGERVLMTVLGVAGVIVIVCGLLVINDHVTCTNLGGLIKGACALK